MLLKKNNERFQIKFVKGIEIFLKKKQTKSDNTVMNDMEIFQTWVEKKYSKICKNKNTSQTKTDWFF